nr:hypothetical protein [Cellulosimicrobium sp. MM]
MTLQREDEAGPALAVETSTRCLAGTAYVAVRATNTGDVPADVTLATPFGTRSVAAVAPGKAAYQSFSTRGRADAGSVTVTGTLPTAAPPSPRTSPSRRSPAAEAPPPGASALPAQAGSSSGCTTTPPNRASCARSATPSIQTLPASTSDDAGEPSGRCAVYPPVSRVRQHDGTARLVGDVLRAPPAHVRG